MKKKSKESITAFIWRKLIPEPEKVCEWDYLEEERSTRLKWPVVAAGAVVFILFMLGVVGIIPTPIF